MDAQVFDEVFRAAEQLAQAEVDAFLATRRPVSMSEGQAEDEAVERWGREGFAHQVGRLCVVGVWRGRVQHPLGTGATWEEAFVAAGGAS